MKRTSPGDSGALKEKTHRRIHLCPAAVRHGRVIFLRRRLRYRLRRISLRGVDARDDDSIKEDPSLTGRLKLDAIGSAWQFHSWLEGGWDGTVRRPPQDSSLFKSYNEVYQSNTPFLEFKELYVSHSSGDLDLRMGVQRFAWGRLDEYHRMTC